MGILLPLLRCPPNVFAHPHPFGHMLSLRFFIQTPVVALTCHQTMLLSKQFVQWDELLSQLEAAKQVKPAEE